MGTYCKGAVHKKGDKNLAGVRVIAKRQEIFIGFDWFITIYSDRTGSLSYPFQFNFKTELSVTVARSENNTNTNY